MQISPFQGAVVSRYQKISVVWMICIWKHTSQLKDPVPDHHGLLQTTCPLSTLATLAQIRPAMLEQVISLSNHRRLFPHVLHQTQRSNKMVEIPVSIRQGRLYRRHNVLIQGGISAHQVAVRFIAIAVLEQPYRSAKTDLSCLDCALSVVPLLPRSNYNRTSTCKSKWRK